MKQFLIALVLFCLLLPATGFADLVCGKVNRKGKLKIQKTTEDTCPGRGFKEIINTEELKGDTGSQDPTGTDGSVGAQGPQGDSVILCFAKIDADTDTVLSFGGLGTTGVSTAESGGSNQNTVTCTGNYPGITSFSDIYVYGNLLKTGAINSGVTIDPAASSANATTFSLKVWTDDSDEEFNILVIGETSQTL